MLSWSSKWEQRLALLSKIQAEEKASIALWLSGKHQAGNKFVYNERLRWIDETEVGSDFLKRSKGTRPRSSKATSALRERAEGSQEAEAAASEIGHYIVTEGLGSEGRRWSSGWN